MTITILPEDVINKIAAGEVVEKPASVVKELLENAIDAKSDFIEIELKNYGKDLIRVSDNGIGMKKEDAMLSIQRHATSKINNADDLFSIATLGFRGEALASIAAVSRTAIITRVPDSDEGFLLEVEGGMKIKEQAAGAAKGTTVEVHNLFFNTPARLKFLKQDSAELKAIADIVTRYALLYSNIAFRLSHNGHMLLSTAKTDAKLNTIVSVYGKDSAKQMMEINFKDAFAEISGYVSKPSLLKSERSYQSFYVNGRYVKDETITQALYDAYHSLLFVNKHPVALLSINLNPSLVDVNVHPSKDRIKFSHPIKVYEAVFNAVRDVLRDNSLITDFSVKEENMPMSRFAPKVDSVQKAPAIQSLQSFSNISSNESQDTLMNANEKNETLALTKLPAMKLLGQIAKTYFLAEADDGFILIDQHVVQERAYYEKFMLQMLQGNVAKQSLLKPELIELAPAQVSVLNPNKAMLAQLGFEVEEFGLGTYTLRAVPSVFGNVQPKELFFEVLEQASEGKLHAVDRLKESIITRMACRASIKGGDRCSIPEFIAMLKELDKCVLPWTCPHGRPIFIQFSKDEIEKMFRRKG
ncbi:MAG: DNA mismatch repair endonuclease MutL [Nanoarchaeota archaeon]|nr:DNA mismatch repair endonuclease MutL [Nanoarchaeota archaeon]